MSDDKWSKNSVLYRHIEQEAEINLDSDFGAVLALLPGVDEVQYSMAKKNPVRYGGFFQGTTNKGIHVATSFQAGRPVFNPIKRVVKLTPEKGYYQIDMGVLDAGIKDISFTISAASVLYFLLQIDGGEEVQIKMVSQRDIPQMSTLETQLIGGRRGPVNTVKYNVTSLKPFIPVLLDSLAGFYA
jgi:hypothetical protein